MPTKPLMKIEIKPSALGFVALMAVFFQAWLGWLEAIVAALLLSVCVLAHELAHAAVAQHFGVAVKKIGFAVEAGYIVRERAPSRGREALIASAGLILNLLLASGFLLIRSKLTYWLAFCNFLLFVFNLVPLGPTDGRSLLKLAVGKQPAALRKS